VAEIATGAEFMIENNSVGINSLTVTFGFIPALNSYRVAILPVR